MPFVTLRREVKDVILWRYKWECAFDFFTERTRDSAFDSEFSRAIRRIKRFKRDAFGREVGKALPFLPSDPTTNSEAAVGGLQNLYIGYVLSSTALFELACKYLACVCVYKYIHLSLWLTNVLLWWKLFFSHCGNKPAHDCFILLFLWHQKVETEIYRWFFFWLVGFFFVYLVVAICFCFKLEMRLAEVVISSRKSEKLL